jgi:hypothetical protein
MGHGLVNGFTDHLYTPLELQGLIKLLLISTLYKSLHAFTSCFLVMNLCNGDSSVSVVMPLPTG